MLARSAPALAMLLVAGLVADLPAAELGGAPVISSSLSGHGRDALRLRLAPLPAAPTWWQEPAWLALRVAMAPAAWPGKALPRGERIWRPSIDHQHWPEAALLAGLSSLAPLRSHRLGPERWQLRLARRPDCLRPPPLDQVRWHQADEAVAWLIFGLDGPALLAEMADLQTAAPAPLAAYLQGWRQQVLAAPIDAGAGAGPSWLHWLSELEAGFGISLHAGRLAPELRCSWPAAGAGGRALAQRAAGLLQERLGLPAALGRVQLAHGRAWLSLAASPAKAPPVDRGAAAELLLAGSHGPAAWRQLAAGLALTAGASRDLEQLERARELAEKLAELVPAEQRLHLSADAAGGAELQVAGSLGDPLHLLLQVVVLLLRGDLPATLASEELAVAHLRHFLSLPVEEHRAWLERLLAFEQGYHYFAFDELASAPRPYYGSEPGSELRPPWVLYAVPWTFGADGQRSFAWLSGQGAFQTVAVPPPKQWHALWDSAGSPARPPRWPVLPLAKPPTDPTP